MPIKSLLQLFINIGLHMFLFQLSPVKKDRFHRPQSCYNLPGYNQTASQSWKNPANFFKGPSPPSLDKKCDLYAIPQSSKFAATVPSAASASANPPLPPRNVPRG